MTPDQLRAVRAKLNLTQPELAKALGVTTDAVARWEGGRSPIRRVVALAVKHLTCK